MLDNQMTKENLSDILIDIETYQRQLFNIYEECKDGVLSENQQLDIGYILNELTECINT